MKTKWTQNVDNSKFMKKELSLYVTFTYQNITNV